MTRRTPAYLAPIAVAVVALALASLAATHAQAPEDSPILEITTTLTPEPATLGQHVELRIVVRHGDDLLLSARPPQRLQGVELVTEDEPVIVSLGSGTTFTTFVFTFAGYDLGTLGLGQIELGWLRSNGTSGTQVLAPPPIEVVRVRAQDDVTLRGLKPQATIEGAPAGWIRPAILATLAVLATVAAAALAWRLWLRRGRVTTSGPYVPDTSAELRARQRLDAVAAVGPRGDGAPDYQAYYGDIAVVVRNYLTQRFGFNAAALTTTELEARMTARGVGRWQARLVSGLLERCDAAVFAHRYPDPTSADRDLTVAFEIVELSRPRASAHPETAAEVDDDVPVPV